MAEFQKLNLGDKITVRTLPGRDGTIISRLLDGRVVLFDQKSEYFDKLAAGQSVEGQVIVISESYVILNPTREPEESIIVHYPEVDVDSIVGELEELVENMSGNAEIIPKALLHVIRLQQLTIRILKEMGGSF